ncbi:hypothetical protein Desti_5665 (plasmid) [Desulfomonile tiedjei DSM 6799]|uniref:Uncharacterized protein n=1 Tax=Desulfomonile tiedjei (strain ATCC 49306 / DSM 6799 / DCB-1) TaxID=706587 RepID=I4CFA3_DESTA|nr:hypothetical protein Desti_5665 [Desulfomonile tiedjei DSM 6799]
MNYRIAIAQLCLDMTINIPYSLSAVGGLFLRRVRHGQERLLRAYA